MAAMVRSLNPTLFKENVSPAGPSQAKGKSRQAPAKGKTAAPARRETEGPDTLPSEMRFLRQQEMKELREKKRNQKIHRMTAKAPIADPRLLPKVLDPFENAVERPDTSRVEQEYASALEVAR